jgi:hypothetical protein
MASFKDFATTTKNIPTGQRIGEYKLSLILSIDYLSEQNVGEKNGKEGHALTAT